MGGEVLMASALAGVPIVVVGHGDTRTTYQPVLASVEVGDLVGAGHAIGNLGVAGSHCSPRACLHWGLIRNGTDPPEYLDPLSLVGFRPVRLLPLTGPTSVADATGATLRDGGAAPPLLLRPRMGLFEGAT
jgi:murein DD-endopeptidase MepM/ murein hydrolase activator NlpD